MVHFGEVWKTWSLRSNSVTRQVRFNRTKMGGQCPNSNATFWVIIKQCDVLWQIVVSCVVWCIHNAFWHSTQFVTLKSKTFAVFSKRNGFAVLWCVSPNEGIGDQESEMVARCLNVVSVRICSTVGGNSFSCSKWPNDTTVHRDTNVVQGPYHINHLGLIHIALPKPANQANQDIHTRTQPPSLLTSAADKINDCFAWRHFQVFNYVQLHLIRQGRNVDDVFFFLGIVH